MILCYGNLALALALATFAETLFYFSMAFIFFSVLGEC